MRGERNSVELLSGDPEACWFVADLVASGGTFAEQGNIPLSVSLAVYLRSGALHLDREFARAVEVMLVTRKNLATFLTHPKIVKDAVFAFI